MEKLYNINEEVPCVLKNYIPRLRAYQLETISDHVTGYIRVNSHPVISRKLRMAHEQHSIIPLRFKGVIDGKFCFWYKLDNTDIQETQKIEENGNSDSNQDANMSGDSVALSEAETIEVPISSDNQDFNKNVINSLISVLGDRIDSDEKYELALNIISANRKFNIDNTLYRTIYNKATLKYQTMFWANDILPYCSNGMVKRAWEEADEETKEKILTRLGIQIRRTQPAKETQADSISTQTAVLDNSGRTTIEIEHEVVQHAINERKVQQNNLNEQRSRLSQQSESLNVQQATIKRQQSNHAANTARRMSQATNNTERQQIENESRIEANKIQERLNSVQTQQNEIQSQIVSVSEKINETQQEIETIQASSNVSTIGGRGKLKINLKWSTIDDVDLHVYDPANNHIYYGDKIKICQGITGQLDVDANAGGPYTDTPQENIYWNDKAPLGHYKVDINLFNKRSGCDNISFTVTIIPEIGESKIFTGILRNNKETINLVEFDYTEEGIKYN